MSGSVDPSGQCPYVFGTGNSGQEREHAIQPTDVLPLAISP